MKRLILSFALFVFVANGFAQTVLEQYIVNSAGESTSNGLMIDFALGEPIVSNQTTLGVITNIGFLQPQLRLVSVKETTESNGEVKVYPNPCRDFTIIETELDNMAHYRLFSESGQLCKSGQFNGRMILAVNDFPSGLYHLSITNQLFARTITLIKP